MGGDVLVAHVRERVGVGAVGAVAHQRAAHALRVVVLGLGEAVVDEEGGAALHAVGQRAHEGLGLQMDFGDGAGHEGMVAHWRAQRCRAVVPGIATVRFDHAALVPGGAVEPQQLHWHGVEHLVAQHHAVQRGRQLVQPLHLRAEPRQPRRLACAQGT